MNTAPKTPHVLLADAAEEHAALAEWRDYSQAEIARLTDERDALVAIIDDARHALAADGPKVEPARQVLARALPQLTAWQDRKRRDRDNTPPHVIAHRGAQLDAVTAERDALRDDCDKLRAGSQLAYMALCASLDALKYLAEHAAGVALPDDDEVHFETIEHAITERDALAAEVDRVRALHYAADNDAARTPICETCHGRAGVHECGCWADHDREPMCGHCMDGWHGASVPWPCPTIRALDGEVDR